MATKSKNSLSKSQFVKLVTEAGEFKTKTDAEKAVNGFIKGIEAALSKMVIMYL